MSGSQARAAAPPLPPTGPVTARTTWDAAAQDLIAWRAGDDLALARLVHRLTPVLWHTVRAYRLGEAAAEDVVQTTWLTFVRRSDTISDPQAVVRWLTVTARREAWRVAQAQARTRQEDEAVLDLQPASGPTVEDLVERGQRDAALWAAVRRLSERCQRLLRVIAFSDRPDYAALAHDLGMPVGSIGPTRGRCLAKLRALLGSATDWRTS